MGFNWSLRGFKFDMSLNYKLINILRTYSDCKASLVSFEDALECNFQRGCLMKVLNVCVYVSEIF